MSSAALAQPSSVSLDGLSRRQLRTVVSIRERWPRDDFVWHPRGEDLLLELRAPAEPRAWTRLVVRFGADGEVEPDRPLGAERRVA